MYYIFFLYKTENCDIMNSNFPTCTLGYFNNLLTFVVLFYEECTGHDKNLL